MPKRWDFQRDVNDFHPKTIRNLPGLEQVGFTSGWKREKTCDEKRLEEWGIKKYLFLKYLE